MMVGNISAKMNCRQDNVQRLLDMMQMTFEGQATETYTDRVVEIARNKTNVSQTGFISA